MAVALAACGAPAPAPDLATYLGGIDDVPRAVASWRLDEAAWQRTVVEPYRPLYPEYVRAFDAAKPALEASLGRPGAIAVRPHYADDPLLTKMQAEARWALPVAFASQVATRGDAPIDAVFVRDGDRWRAIAGLDVVIRTQVDAFAGDQMCGSLLDRPSPSKRCREISWEIADSALRIDGVRFTHACALAAGLCGKPSP